MPTGFVYGVAAAVVATSFFLWQAVPVPSDMMTIAWIGPLSGSAAILGVDAAVAAELAVADLNAKGGINGKQLKLIIEDDQYDTTKSLSAYEKVVRQNGARVVMTQTYGAMFALAERAARDNVILVNVLDCNDRIAELGDHVWCVGVDTEGIARELATYAERKGYRSLGVLFYKSDTFMPYVKDVLREEFSGEIISEGHAVDENDFRTTLTKMKNKNVDALVFLGYDETGVAMHQARVLGLKQEFMAPDTISSPSLQTAARGAIENAVFTAWKAPDSWKPAKAFEEKFIEKTGRKPLVSIFAYPAYDATLLLAEAFSKSETPNKASIAKIQNWEGVTGTLSFDSNGTVKIPYSLFRMDKNGDRVPL